MGGGFAGEVVAGAAGEERVERGVDAEHRVDALALDKGDGERLGGVGAAEGGDEGVALDDARDGGEVEVAVVRDDGPGGELRAAADQQRVGLVVGALDGEAGVFDGHDERALGVRRRGPTKNETG